MRFSIILLLFAVCRPSTSLGIYREDVGFQRDFQGNSEFANSFSNWFRNLKDRVYEKLFGSINLTLPPPLDTEVLNLDRVDLQHRLRNRERFLVDLSTLSFNPESDWGFRVGNWYFIRKGSDARTNEAGEWDVNSQGTVPPGDLDNSGFKLDVFDEENDRSAHTPLPNIPLTELPTSTVIESMAQEANTQSTTETDMEIGFSTRTAKRIEDNEADRFFIHDDSVMVLTE